jgi:hypothetical protein
MARCQREADSVLEQLGRLMALVVQGSDRADQDSVGDQQYPAVVGG